VRLVVDTNVLISALLARSSLPAHLVTLWRERWFDLLTSAEQLEELVRVTRYPRIRERLTPAVAGRLVNELRAGAVLISNPPKVDACTDPNDNYLLAISSAGAADFLITGDKRDLLRMKRYQGVRIVPVGDFLALTHRLP
jgi:putative PIN family toxin of toxin-antitoxin system